MKKINNRTQSFYSNGYIAHDYTLNLDKLHITLKSVTNKVLNFNEIKTRYKENNSWFEVSSDFQLKLNQERDKQDTNYNYCFNLYLKNKFRGQLYTDCRFSYGKEYLKFAFSCQELYENDNWLGVVESIEKALQVKVNNLICYDIAYDSYKLTDKFEDLYLRSTIRKYHTDYQIKPRFKPFNKVSVISFNNDSSYLVGKGSKVIAIYNKTKEIQEKSGKDYITQFHALNGLDTSKEIHRVEVRIRKQYGKDFGISLNTLSSLEGLHTVFQEFTERSLKFQDLENCVWINRNATYSKVDVIDYSSFKSGKLAKIVSNDISDKRREKRIKDGFKILVLNWLYDGSGLRLQRIRDFMADKLHSLNVYGSSKDEYEKLILKVCYEYDQPNYREAKGRISNAVDIIFGRNDPYSALKAA